ncbi:hypothetical protein [Spiroplasma endosymbiont of Ammophila pubescens]
MYVVSTILFFDINLDANNELHELGIIKESYSIDLTNDLDLNLWKK